MMQMDLGAADVAMTQFTVPFRHHAFNETSPNTNGLPVATFTISLGRTC